MEDDDDDDDVEKREVFSQRFSERATKGKKGRGREREGRLGGRREPGARATAPFSFHLAPNFKEEDGRGEGDGGERKKEWMTTGSRGRRQKEMS